MIPPEIGNQLAAIVGASGFLGAWVEAYRTRRAVMKHDRYLEGTDHRKGVVQLVNENLRNGGKRREN